MYRRRKPNTLPVSRYARLWKVARVDHPCETPLTASYLAGLSGYASLCPARATRSCQRAECALYVQLTWRRHIGTNIGNEEQPAARQQIMIGDASLLSTNGFHARSSEACQNPPAEQSATRARATRVSWRV